MKRKKGKEKKRKKEKDWSCGDDLDRKEGKKEEKKEDWPGDDWEVPPGDDWDHSRFSGKGFWAPCGPPWRFVGWEELEYFTLKDYLKRIGHYAGKEGKGKGHGKESTGSQLAIVGS